MSASFSMKSSRAFSLIEMLVVIAIMGMLVTLVVFNMDSIFGSNQKEVAKQFVNNALEAPLFSYKANMGSYPTTQQGLKALLKSPGGSNSEQWSGPYIKKLPKDPWKNDYQYEFPGKKNTNGYDLYSFGPDGIKSEDDIGNW